MLTVDEIKSLVRFAKEVGAKTFRVDEMEVTFVELPVGPSTVTMDQYPKTEQPTEQDLLYWSSQDHQPAE